MGMDFPRYVSHEKHVQPVDESAHYDNDLWHMTHDKTLYICVNEYCYRNVTKCFDTL